MSKKDLYEFFSSPLLLGHRGNSALAPENTFASYKLCDAPGIDGIEIDVQECSTGELVLTHEFNLKQLFGIDRTVQETPYSFLKDLDAGAHFGSPFNGERIPLLNEVFSTFSNRFHYDLEIKSNDIHNYSLPAKLYAMIREYSLESHCLVSSFNPLQVRAFRKYCASTIPTAVIYADKPGVPRYLRHGAGRWIAGSPVLKPENDLLSDRVFRRDHNRRGYPMICWSIDEPARAEKLYRAGVEGIISNDPNKLAEIRMEFS